MPCASSAPGATSGIGREVARKLAADGFAVLVHGRDAARGAAVVNEITASGGQARFIAADLAPDTFDQLFAANVRSAYYLVAAIAPRMAKRGTGSILKTHHQLSGDQAASRQLAGSA